MSLRETHEFDSIDAIELLREIEILLKTQLTQDEKKAAMDIRTINQIVDYVETIWRCKGPPMPDGGFPTPFTRHLQPQDPSAMERRVVITGAAAITPIGCTAEAILHHLTNGVSGVSKIKDDGLLTRHIHSGVFGSVDYPIRF